MRSSAPRATIFTSKARSIRSRFRSWSPVTNIISSGSGIRITIDRSASNANLVTTFRQELADDLRDDLAVRLPAELRHQLLHDLSLVRARPRADRRDRAARAIHDRVARQLLR